MVTGRIGWILVLAMLLPAGGWTRDYPDPVDVLNPLYRSGQNESLSFIDGVYSRIWFDDATFFSGDEDEFTIGLQTATRLAAWQDRLALTHHFASILLVGPVRDDEEPVSVAEWWMNAVQYQYGLHAAVQVASIDVIFGYGRTSLHPLRAGYSEIARDKLYAGGMYNFLRGSAGAVLRWSSMLDLWQSHLPQPRTILTLEAPVLYEYPLSDGYQLFAELYPRLQWNRYGPPLDFEPSGRAGLRIGSSASWLDVYMHWYRTYDSEQLLERRYATTVVGLGVSAAGRSGLSFPR